MFACSHLGLMQEEKKKHILEIRTQEMNRGRNTVQCGDKSTISDSGDRVFSELPQAAAQ